MTSLIRASNSNGVRTTENLRGPSVTERVAAARSHRSSLEQRIVRSSRRVRAQAALSIRDSLSRRNLGQRYANQDLPLHGVTLSVSVGLVRSHVSHRDPSGPRKQLRR